MELALIILSIGAVFYLLRNDTIDRRKVIELFKKLEKEIKEKDKKINELQNTIKELENGI